MNLKRQQRKNMSNLFRTIVRIALLTFVGMASLSPGRFATKNLSGLGLVLYTYRPESYKKLKFWQLSWPCRQGAAARLSNESETISQKKRGMIFLPLRYQSVYVNCHFPCPSLEDSHILLYNHTTSTHTYLQTFCLFFLPLTLWYPQIPFIEGESPARRSRPPL